MTHSRRSRWLSLGSLPIVSGLVIASLGCSPRDDVAGHTAKGSGGSSGSGGDAGSGGSSGAGGSATTGGPNCVTGNGFLCAPDDLNGFPFVQFAISYSNFAIFSEGIPPAGQTTVTMRHPEPGVLCLSGRVPPGEPLAGFNLHFSRRNQDGTRIVAPFDAASLGIAKVAVTIDSPPSAGVRLALFTVKRLDCLVSPLDCNDGFGYGNLAAGPAIVPLADFTDAADPGVPLDLSVLDAFLFQVGPGDYDFCIRDFRLLDAEDTEVRPQ